MKKMGLYIHIPFCIKKCGYCDFYSIEGDSNAYKSYVKYLAMEMKLHSNEYRDREIDAIFVGGGTPTILAPKELSLIFEALRENFNLSKVKEFTFEANPETIREEKLKVLKENGVNRLSIGLQSTWDEELQLLERVHSYDRFLRAYEDARKAGFENINIDLMFSIPGQTRKSWEQTLEKVVKLNPEHISAYSLILEENTNFQKLKDEGKLEVPKEDTELWMFHKSIDYLQKNGYEHYEISNFAKKKKKCIHNIGYWERKDYLGLGPAAHSMVDNCRFSNVKDIISYKESLKKGKLPQEEKQILTQKEALEERIFLGLRMMKGLDLKVLDKEFDINFKEEYKEVLEKLESKSLITVKNDILKLTALGVDLSNRVFVEFIS